MNFDVILGRVDFLEFLRGSKATFLLAGSVTKTCEIPNISQLGIPGRLDLTPTLDAEFLCTKEVRSLEDIPKTSEGLPSPSLITRAVHELKPFSNIEILDLGLEVKPKIDYFKTHHFSIKPSKRIDDGASIDAMSVFQAGVEFGTSYKTSDDYIILAESVPSGTITSNASALALGYECKNSFATSDIKSTTLEEALKSINEDDDVFTKLSRVSDNMLIFNAGFILGSRAQNLKVILAGGIQMVTVLLIVNSILKSMDGNIDASNIALCTSKWVAQDDNTNIKGLLEQVDFSINAYASDFDFLLSSNQALKLYDEGESRDGVGCGAALCYASINAINKENLTRKIESFLK